MKERYGYYNDLCGKITEFENRIRIFSGNTGRKAECKQTGYLLKDNIQRERHDSLDRVVLKFLGSAKDMDNISEELIEIMRDGIIDDEEKIKMDSIIETLDSISQIISEIKQKINMQ